MSAWNERCDCCGEKQQRAPSDIYPGEELTGWIGSRQGWYCVPCHNAIYDHYMYLYLPPNVGEVMPCPKHHPDWWERMRKQLLAEIESTTTEEVGR